VKENNVNAISLLLNFLATTSNSKFQAYGREMTFFLLVQFTFFSSTHTVTKYVKDSWHGSKTKAGEQHQAKNNHLAGI
jgi:hypothetical protein